MKSIPTEYNGLMFRSRLEATWAAFFDNIQWQWEYEPFECGNWIPDFGIRCLDKKPLLAEVKPIMEFDKSIVEKIEISSIREKLLILGVGPFLKDGSICIGWTNDIEYPFDESSWSEAPLGIWEGSESKEKNENKIIGFCSSVFSFKDRITGCYDGGCFGNVSGHGFKNEIMTMWKNAKNKTQWNRRG